MILNVEATVQLRVANRTHRMVIPCGQIVGRHDGFMFVKNSTTSVSYAKKQCAAKKIARIHAETTAWSNAYAEYLRLGGAAADFVKAYSLTAVRFIDGRRSSAKPKSRYDVSDIVDLLGTARRVKWYNLAQ